MFQLQQQKIDKAEILPQHFSCVFTIAPVSELPAFECRAKKTIENIIITVEILRKEIIKLINNKLPSLDEVPPRILKEFITYESGPLMADEQINERRYFTK